MKVSELDGVLLDYWVYLAEDGAPLSMATSRQYEAFRYRSPDRKHYSVRWADGGPIMDEGRIDTGYCGDDPEETPWVGQWWAQIAGKFGDADHHEIGPTRLIAAMRTFVASKFGDSVPDN